MNEMFTEQARQVIERARDEALSHEQDFIGTQHILLALIQLGQGKALDALSKLGVNLEELATKTEEYMREKAEYGPIHGALPLTGWALRALEASALEARARNSKDIDTHDVLLALLKDEETRAAKIMLEFGIDYQKLRDELSNT